MQVHSITPFSVRYPEPNDNDSERYLVFVRATADDGTVGWGEAITQLPAPTRATHAMVGELEELVVGADPLANVEIWRRLKHEAWWYGYRGGIFAFALSAIDMALWDLKGKLLGQPLVDLLGGAHRNEIPVTAATHAFSSSLEEEAERHGRYVHEDGFMGVKVGMGKAGDARLGYEVDRDVEYVRLLREAIGRNALLMMDRGAKLTWTLRDAIRRADAWAEYDLEWFEEPLEPHDHEGFKRLRPHVRCLLAGGEREWDERGYREVIETGVLDVIGVDAGRAEGVTGTLRVISLIEQHGLWFNSHAWSSAIGTAAAIALSASTSRSRVQELKPIPSPMQDELVEEPAAPRAGVVDVPRLPGLGVDVRESVLETYRY